MDLQSFYQGLRNISEQIVYMLTCINNNGVITLTVAAKSCYTTWSIGIAKWHIAIFYITGLPFTQDTKIP